MEPNKDNDQINTQENLNKTNNLNSSINEVVNGENAQSNTNESTVQYSQVETPVSGLNSTTYPQAEALVNNAAEQPSTNMANSHNSASVLILQWITYLFWGWTLLVLSLAIFFLVLSLINGSEIGSRILYPVSALVILLPVAVIADAFYGKKEPKTKKGVALAIMVVHVVIYAIFLAGFLISAMFSLVSMFTTITSEEQNDALGYLISSLIVAALYGLLILRTLKPEIFRSLNEEN